MTTACDGVEIARVLDARVDRANVFVVAISRGMAAIGDRCVRARARGAGVGRADFLIVAVRVGLAARDAGASSARSSRTARAAFVRRRIGAGIAATTWANAVGVAAGGRVGAVVRISTHNTGLGNAIWFWRIAVIAIGAFDALTAGGVADTNTRWAGAVTEAAATIGIITVRAIAVRDARNRAAKRSWWVLDAGFRGAVVVVRDRIAVVDPARTRDAKSALVVRTEVVLEPLLMLRLIAARTDENGSRIPG